MPLLITISNGTLIAIAAICVIIVCVFWLVGRR